LADDEWDSGFTPPPSEDDYAVKPSAKRREPTEGDRARNRGVAKLFARVKPGIPIDAGAAELRYDPPPFAALVERVLKKLNIQESPWMDELNRAWPALVAPGVARDARPGKFADGILFVFVTSSVRLFELRRSSLRDIERAVRAFPGGERVRQVRLMVDAVPLSAPSP
jgi:hypothetical protein